MYKLREYKVSFPFLVHYFMGVVPSYIKSVNFCNVPFLDLYVRLKYRNFAPSDINILNSGAQLRDQDLTFTILMHARNVNAMQLSPSPPQNASPNIIGHLEGELSLPAVCCLVSIT